MSRMPNKSLAIRSILTVLEHFKGPNWPRSCSPPRHGLYTVISVVLQRYAPQTLVLEIHPVENNAFNFGFMGLLPKEITQLKAFAFFERANVLPFENKPHEIYVMVYC